MGNEDVAPPAWCESRAAGTLPLPVWRGLCCVWIWLEKENNFGIFPCVVNCIDSKQRKGR